MYSMFECVFMCATLAITIDIFLTPHPHTLTHACTDDDDVRLSMEMDEKITNAATFTIMCEDHTLGNMLRMALLESDNVIFSGYKIPHPLEYELLLKVRTVPSSDPGKELQKSVSNLLQRVALLDGQFKEQLKSVRGQDGEYL